MYSAIDSPSQYRVALYIRLSKEDESDGPSQSVQNQESLLREFTAQHHLQIADIYIDVYNQRLIPFDTKKAVQTPKITAFEGKNASRKPLFLFFEVM
ncbi:MAG: hypothetical protein ACOX7F_08715, partial [Eubacteriales bacterium]